MRYFNFGELRKREHKIYPLMEEYAVRKDRDYIIIAVVLIVLTFIMIFYG